MQVTAEKDKVIADKIFGDIYPYLLKKVEKKGRTEAELLQVIEWLTGFDKKQLDKLTAEKVTYKTFFEKATIHPNAHLIKGVICGYRVEDITFETTKKARQLDKLVDELAKGRKMEKILREEKA